ncbi:Putative nucleotidyltransferase (modular protein) [Verrucomicrobia bacterium]|nr:Putative nucleotidyltransferase (modular protein) [Verrucomicrobiota bacterium]
MVKRSQIRAFSDAVVRQFRPQKIVLFGSYAYGKPTENSDVDLLVIMPRTRDRGERMSVRIRHAIPRNFPLDLLVRTPSDVAKRLRWGDPFIHELLKKGKVLYESYPGHAATLREARTALKHCRSLRAEARRALGLKN